MTTWNNISGRVKTLLAISGAAGTILTTSFTYGAMTGVRSNKDALEGMKSELGYRVANANVAHERYDSTLALQEKRLRSVEDDRIKTQKDIEYIKQGIDEIKRQVSQKR